MLPERKEQLYEKAATLLMSLVADFCRFVKTAISNHPTSFQLQFFINVAFHCCHGSKFLEMSLVAKNVTLLQAATCQCLKLETFCDIVKIIKSPSLPIIVTFIVAINC